MQFADMLHYLAQGRQSKPFPNGNRFILITPEMDHALTEFEKLYHGGFYGDPMPDVYKPTERIPKLKLTGVYKPDNWSGAWYPPIEEY